MKINDCTLRLETENDRYEVECLAREAFWNLSVQGCSEHYFMHVLRQHECFIPQLDFVAVKDGRIIGSVMYSRSYLLDMDGNRKDVLTMGPICVLPEFQRMGLSKLLLDHTFALGAGMGYEVVINYGNPDNYVARGYKSCLKYNISLEGDIFPSALLVKELKEGALDGRKWYYFQNDADLPCDDEAAVEEYDKLFPPKIKAWQPSQEEFYIHRHSLMNRR